MTALPTYLNEEFFREALAKTLNTNVDIKDLQIKRNTVGGNYCSDIYRATVKYECNNKLTEAKLLVKDLFENLSVTSKEHFMYTIVLPEMNAILKKSGIEKTLSPKLYLSQKSSGETHIFEDLNARGYEICDRLVGYNEGESKMVLWKLGQFHAASMVYREKHPEIKFNTAQEVFTNFMGFISKAVNDNANHVIDIVKTWPEYADIAEKMRKNMGENFDGKFLSILKKESGEVNVVAHGDLWIKNILLLEKDQLVEDAIFLDYQNCFIGSPGLDINNVLITSVGLDVLKSKRLDLINHYYESLRDTLKLCEYAEEKIPKLQSILNEIERTEYFTYYGLLFAFPQTNLSEELAKDMDFAGFYDEERIARNRVDMFSNPRVLDTYKHVLKRLNDLGVLD